MTPSIDIVITSERLDILKAESFVADDALGGEVIFIGRVRNHSKGKVVVQLDFEAMEGMAIKEMRKIASTVLERFTVRKVAIHHATGKLEIGEIPVVIAVGAAHRTAAFEACQYCIDTLKQNVPIWKKEIFSDGEEWVSPTP